MNHRKLTSSCDVAVDSDCVTLQRLGTVVEMDSFLIFQHFIPSQDSDSAVIILGFTAFVSFN